MKNALRLQAAYVGGNTKRWHAEDIIGEQRVSAHTWGMTAIYLILCTEPSVDVLRALVFHDAPEPFSGDIPWFARKAHKGAASADAEISERWFAAVGTGGNPAPHYWTNEEYWWIKTLDAAEAYFFSKMQIAMGNRLMEGPTLELVSRLEDARQSEHAPHNAFQIIQDIFDTKIGKRLTRDISELETM
jgi:hypothetical protein